MNCAKPWLAALATLLLGACSGGVGSIDDEPPGILLVGRTLDLQRLLHRLATLEGTPLAREAGQLAERLPSCTLLEAQAPDAKVETLWRNMRCAPSRSDLSLLHEQLRGAAVAFVWPLESGTRLRGRISFDHRDNAEIELDIPFDAARGPARMLLPGAEPPGRSVLSGADILLHARMRPSAGLDLASLVPEGGQADRMFQLKSELFAGAVLDGTWEAAIYLPEEDAPMPRAALGLGFRSRSPAVSAVENFVAELEETWSIQRAPYRTADAEGACLPELRILPDFAPCYVATASTLVLGWNAASIEKALDGRVGSLGSVGGLVVELARFPEADSRLAQAVGASPEAIALGPWARLRAIGREEEDGVRLRLHLEGGGGA